MRSFKIIPLLFVAITLAVASCKPTEKIVVAEKKIKRLGVGRVIRYVDENAVKFNTLNVGRVAISIDKDGKSNSLRGSYKISKDSLIQISAQKIAIPIGKLEARIDSFDAVYYLDKVVYSGTYKYVSELLGTEIDFTVLQSILGCQVFSFKQDDNDREFKDYYIDIVDDMYKISSIHQRKARKLFKNEEKLDRLKNRSLEKHLIRQDIYIDPEMFYIRKMVFDDIEINRIVTIEFTEYSMINEQWFPGNIKLTLNGSGAMILDIKLSKVSIDEEQNFNFNIPERFHRKLLN